MALVAEAEQGSGGDPASLERAPEDRERRDPDSAADEDRPRGLRCGLGGQREGPAERAGEPQALAGGEGRKPLGSRADRLDQEVEPNATTAGLGGGDGERAGQVRPAVLSAPSASSRQHVELAGGGLEALAVERREDPIAAAFPRLDDLGGPPAERRQHALAHLVASAAGCCVWWISWRQRGSTPLPRWAEIARTAAEAPVIVVTQGMPCR